MRIIGTILEVLEKPDDQRRDWYGWATNQMSHCLLGVLVALSFPSAPFSVTIIFALLKESFDILKTSNLRTIRDSATDLAFWIIGTSIISLENHFIGMILLFSGLSIGIFTRIRKFLREAR